MAAPNQRIIYIERVSDKVKSNFFKIGHEQLRKAASDLGGSAFKLYIYLCNNKDSFRFELSSKDFMAWSDISETTYNKAFNELKEKGYLINAKDKKNIYLFVEVSTNYDERHKEDKIVLSEKETIKKLFYES